MRDLKTRTDFYLHTQSVFMDRHPELTEDEYYDLFDEEDCNLMSRDVFDAICGEYDFDRAAASYYFMQYPEGMEDYDTLKEKALKELQSDDVEEARRILDGLNESTWYYYKYGQDPVSLSTTDDVAKFIGFREPAGKKSA